MFLGHVALGFAAKPAAPRTNLAVLIAAGQFADMLWPVLVAAGIEHVRIAPGDTAFTPLEFVSYPYSHSLVMLIVWGVLFGVIYRQVTGQRVALLLGALVVSHWLLDFVTHRPDMSLYPGGAKYGLGLWNSVAGTIGVEVPMYAAGLWFYVRATRPRDAIGRWGLASLALFLLIVYFISAPPPSVKALYISAFVAIGVLTAWAWWVDRHRV